MRAASSARNASAAAGGGVSISDLFAAGVIPALLLAATLMVTAYVVARKRGYAAEAFPGFRAVAVRLVAAIPGLLLVFTGVTLCTLAQQQQGQHHGHEA